MIFTIGHSTHAIDEFCSILDTKKIELLVDVRRYPGSRRYPQFSKDALAQSLAEHRIEYAHMPGLGGRRKPLTASAWVHPGFRGYADHMRTREFIDALGDLEKMAMARTTAVMCSEGPWWKCHRRLLADALVLHRWEVAHLMPDGRTTMHEPTKFMVDDDGIPRYPEVQV